MQRHFLSVRDFCHMFGIGRTAAYQLFADGDIEVRKHGRRTLVDAQSALRWARSLPTRSEPSPPAGGLGPSGEV